jgi:MFS family permease
MVLGSLLYAAVRHTPSLALIGTSTLTVAAAYLGMAGAQTLLIACVLSVLGGIGNGIQWVAVITAIQERTADGYQARVIGLLESAAAAMPGIGFVLGGVLTTIFTPRAAYATAGAGILVVLAAGAVLLRQSAPAEAALPPPRVPGPEEPDRPPDRVDEAPLGPATALARSEAARHRDAEDDPE